MSQYVASAFDHEMSNFAVFCVFCVILALMLWWSFIISLHWLLIIKVILILERTLIKWKLPREALSLHVTFWICSVVLSEITGVSCIQYHRIMTIELNVLYSKIIVKKSLAYIIHMHMPILVTNFWCHTQFFLF